MPAHRAFAGRRRRRSLSLVLVAAGAAALSGASGCTPRQRARAETAIARAVISDRDEARIGEEVKAELARRGVRPLEDPVVVRYVEGIAARVFGPAGRERPGAALHVHVIDDARTVNAFATPGGHLYVHSGLLLVAEDEAQVAGVLAHEAGHVVRRHAARQLVDAYGLQAILSLALGKNPRLLETLAGRIAATGLLLAHSREQEREADEAAVRFTADAGYDPRGIVDFFRILRGSERQGPKAVAWLSTHPSTADRIAAVERAIRRAGAVAGERGAERHAVVRDRLERAAVRGRE